MRLGEDRSMDVETISTGSLALTLHWVQVVRRWDVLLKFHGPESSGKTTLTLQVIAAAQRQGRAFIDANTH